MFDMSNQATAVFSCDGLDIGSSMRNRQEPLLRVLHVVPNMQQGGLENYIMNLYRNINRNVVQFDFLEHYSQESHFDNEIEALGGRIFRIPFMEDKNILGYVSSLNDLFADNPQIKVVHGHMATTALIYLGAAKRAGINARIIHAHESSYLKTVRGYIRRVLIKQAWRNASVLAACSEKAGRYYYGSKSFHILYNAIDVKRFSFDCEKRKLFRREQRIPDDSLVVGHIGRFSAEKNQLFLLGVFEKLLEHNPNSYLLMVGEGETLSLVEDAAKSRELEDSVRFIHPTAHPENAYCGMDVFVLPSLYEGLPLTGVEAQCSGLPCVFSTNVTREVALTDSITFMDLRESYDDWAVALLRAASLKRDRDACRRVAEGGYDAKLNAIQMEDFYLSIGLQ